MFLNKVLWFFSIQYSYMYDEISFQIIHIFSNIVNSTFKFFMGRKQIGIYIDFVFSIHDKLYYKNNNLSADLWIFLWTKPYYLQIMTVLYISWIFLIFPIVFFCFTLLLRICSEVLNRSRGSGPSCYISDSFNDPSQLVFDVGFSYLGVEVK